ncbi:MAG: NUDIX hydrolase [Cyanobium sp.]
MLEVALAMVKQQGQWLLQLRDDLDWIVAPGCWGLFGGHLERGESPEQALRRELFEEIRWDAGEVNYWFEHRNHQRVAHFFLTSLQEPFHSLQLQEGQDLRLASLAELQTGLLWSPAIEQHRPLAPSLQMAVQRLGGEACEPQK